MALVPPRTCYLCNASIPVYGPESHSILTHAAGNEQNRTDLFHKPCVIKSLTVIPRCPICLDDSCQTWQAVLHSEGGLERLSVLGKKWWKRGVTVQIVSQKLMGRLLLGRMIASQICAAVALRLEPNKRVWMVPLVILLNSVEFALRFAGGAALVWWAAGPLGISFSLFSLYMVSAALYINNSKWTEHDSSEGKLACIFFAYFLVFRLSSYILNKGFFYTGFAVPIQLKKPEIHTSVPISTMPPR